MNENEIYNKFFLIEKELNLFDKTIDEIYFWKLVRFKVLFEIFYESKLIVSRKNPKSSNRFKKTICVIQNAVFKSTFREHSRKDILVFENPRKIKNANNKYIDPFTYSYINKLSKDNINYEIIDIGHKGKHYNNVDDFRKYSDDIYYDVFYKIINKIKKTKIKKEDFELILLIQNKIYDEIGVEISIIELVRKKIDEFKYQFNKFSKLFRIKKPKDIYLVCSYGKEGLIHAAHQNKINVIEFQHGVMGNYHLGYSFPDNVKVSYFPDKIFLFGEFWKKNTKLPIDQIEVDYFDFEYLTSRLNSYRSVEKHKQVLVLSQPGNIKDLINITLRLSDKNKGFNFTFRLHPKERKDWESNYTQLYKESVNRENLEIDSGENELYEQIAKSEFVLGVNSAAVFESVMLDAKLLLVNSPGIEYMKYIIDSGYATLLDKDSEIELNSLRHTALVLDKKFFYRH